MALQVSDGMLGLVRKLGHTDKKPRDKAVDTLKLFLSSRRAASTTEMDFMKLWKGLFYCMWMSDKTPVQQELAAMLASLVHRFADPALAALWLRAFYLTMRREWAGIDKYRLDKYYSLMRKVLHESFGYLREASWDDACVEAVVEGVRLHFTGHEETKRQGIGVTMHYFETYMAELYKAVGAGITTSQFEALFVPVLKGYATTVNMDKRFLNVLETNVLDVLAEDYWFEDCRDEMLTGEDEEADDEKVFRSTQLAKIAPHVWAAASAPDTVQQRRKVLYAVHKRLKRALRVSGTHYTVTVAPIEKDLPSMSPIKKGKPEEEGRNDGLPSATSSKGSSLLVVEDELRQQDEEDMEEEIGSSGDDLNDSIMTEKMFDSDDEQRQEEDDEELELEDGWSSDDCRDIHGPALPPGWDTGTIKKKKKKKKKKDKKEEEKKKKTRRVSIQLKNNQFKAYKNSVRDLKRRKLKNASQSPEPRASILKKETEIQKAVGAIKMQTKSGNRTGKKRKNNMTTMQFNTTNGGNQFSVLASSSLGRKNPKNGRRDSKSKKRRR